MNELTEARQAALEAQEQILDAQEKLAGAIKRALLSGLAPTFRKYEFLAAVAWTQATPFFNDGDACVFSSGIDYAILATAEDVEESNFEEENQYASRSLETRDEYVRGFGTEPSRWIEHPNDDYDPRYAAAEKEVHEYVRSLVGDVKRDYTSNQPSVFDSAMLAAFGDHAQVVINRDGTIVVDEWLHD